VAQLEQGVVMTLLSPGAVGRRLRLSTSRVQQLDREGSLRAMRDSANRRLYDADAVEEFAREREGRLARTRSAEGV
jgi:DNA-binding transcriptional MerR regulator